VPFKLSTLRPVGREKWHAIGAGSVVSSMVAVGSDSDLSASTDQVCFAPKSGHRETRTPSPFGANNGLMHRSKQHHHSITWSARASSVAGISIPSVLAVLRLMISSSPVGCSMGKSAGLVPSRIFFT